MSSEVRPFRWTVRSEEAAALVAADTLSDLDIAARAGVTDRQLRRWKRHPDFMARVGTHLAQARAIVKARGIAERQNRVDALNDRWQRMRQVIEARAVDPDLGDAAGGATGLLVRTYKIVGTGPSAYTVDEYAVDTGLLRELRAHEEQAAKELGQWTEKHDLSGSVLIREYGGFDPDDV